MIKYVKAYYKVTGDHPTFKRPDEVFTDRVKAGVYATDLRTAGYENVRIRKRFRKYVKVKT